MSGCGEKAQDDSELRARNLKTGEIHTFSTESDVPDGYALCADEDCSVPEQVPCELLGAEVCQYQPNCRIKVISCTSGGVDYAMGCAEPTLPGAERRWSEARRDRDRLRVPRGDRDLEVACISKDFQLCNEITDAQTCAARPECDWVRDPAPDVRLRRQRTALRLPALRHRTAASAPTASPRPASRSATRAPACPTPSAAGATRLLHLRLRLRLCRR